jgi:hypothetical protein
VACRKLVLETRAEAERRLLQCEAIRRELAEEEENTEDRPYWLLTVSAGEHSAQATIDWVDETLAALDELQRSHEGSHPRTRRKTG